MKKLLSFLASLVLLATSSSVVVACSGPQTALTYGELGVLKELLGISEDSLKDFKTAKSLYEAVAEKIADKNSYNLVNQETVESFTKATSEQYYEVIVYRQSMSDEKDNLFVNADGNPTVKEEDFGKVKDRRFIKVSYSKQLVRGILKTDQSGFEQGSVVIWQLESDFATFAIVNQA